MAITYGFYNSMNGDRKYDAVQLSSIFDGVIRDGVFQSIGGYLATKPGTGMQVIVSPGKAWFDHTWTVNDADLPLDISPSDVTLSRYDAVILETDATKAVRENSIKVIKGTPASDPKKPTLTNEGDVHQHPLAYILVPGGSSSIQVQNIDIMVGKTECPFVTSILESVSIEALLEKWEGEFKAWSAEKENDFQTWFDDLQSQMEGDVATNLQNQINKINQTTATEETKSLYGVPSDGTPDDVFQAINSIGDIKITARSDLDDHWLLCNGELVDVKKYPILNDMLPSEPAVWDAYNIGSNLSAYIYLCGEYIVEFTANGYRYRFLDVRTRAWSSYHNMPSDMRTGTHVFSYVDGFYLMYSTKANNFYYVTSDLNGSWKKVTLPQSRVFKFPVKTSDGYAAILDFESTSSATKRYIATAPSLESGEWTASPLPHSYGTVNFFDYKGGTFIYTVYNSSSGVIPYNVYYFSGETPPPSTDGWSNKTYSRIYWIKQIDGSYYIRGYMDNAANGIYKTDSINFPDIGTYIVTGVADLVKLGNTWVAQNRTKTGATKELSEMECVTEQGTDVKFIFILDDKVRAFTNASGGVSRISESDEASLIVARLPTIALDSSYAYIRGK